MLAACGLQKMEDLCAHLPQEALLHRPLDIPAGVSEYEITDYFKQQAARNANGYASFLGAGVYAHYRPVLCDVVVSRGEFLTSYTPYQAEIAQGTLTTIYEFQTMLCQLTGMEVANASMYDGSTAVPEAAMMASAHYGTAQVSGVLQRSPGVPGSAGYCRAQCAAPRRNFRLRPGDWPDGPGSSGREADR